MTEREIFLAVLDLPDAPARSEYLDRVCSGDPARRARIEALLRSHDAAGSFLGRPAVAPPQPNELETQAFDTVADTDADNAADADLNFLETPRRPDSLGRIGHYEVLAVPGKGGFGIVFRGFDDVLQRVVAIKVLAPHVAATSPARKRFLREARSSAAIRHENVVQVYAVEEQPLPYLVMEFIPGETLQQRLDRTGPLETDEVLRIGRQIAEALAAAHAEGLIHRDVKPGNILIEAGPNQHVKITDFGLARAADDASMTQSGVVAGTPMYMAPEQAQGDKIDHRVDLFSFGSVLYTICSGRPPFRANNMLAVLKRVTEDTPRPIPEIIPEVPQWLCDIIEKLLAKNPDDRFQTAREVADLLAHHQNEWKTAGAATAFRDREILPTLKPDPVPDSALVPPAPARKRIKALALAAIVLICLAAVFWISRSAEPKRGTGPAGAAPERVADKGIVVVPKQEATTSPPPTPAEPERELAEWLRRQPGMGPLRVIREVDGQEVVVKPDEVLPNLPFFVGRILWEAADDITDADLVRIGKARRLQGLTLAAREGKFSKVTDNGLSGLLSPKVCKSLLGLNLESTLTNVTAEGYLAVNRAHELRELLVLKMSSGQGEFLSRLTGLSKLGTIRIEGEDIPGGWIAALPDRMPDIEILTLQGVKATPDDIQALPKLDRLFGLVFSDADLDDKALATIGTKTKLRWLNLYGNPAITDLGLAHLTELTGLENLDLQAAGVTDHGVTQLAGMTGLKKLVLANTIITDESCQTLSALAELEMLELGGTRVTDAGLARLTALKNLRSLNLNLCKRITDQGLESVAQLRSLTDFRILAAPQLSEAAVRKLQAALPNCKILSDYSGLAKGE